MDKPDMRGFGHDFTRYDIIEAHYWFCTHYHEGQSSERYARLSRLGRIFRPGIMANGPEPDSAAQLIYDELVAREESK